MYVCDRLKHFNILFAGTDLNYLLHYRSANFTD